MTKDTYEPSRKLKELRDKLRQDPTLVDQVYQAIGEEIVAANEQLRRRRKEVLELLSEANKYSKKLSREYGIDQTEKRRELAESMREYRKQVREIGRNVIQSLNQKLGINMPLS